jgi:hypothetical protein
MKYKYDLRLTDSAANDKNPRTFQLVAEAVR